MCQSKEQGGRRCQGALLRQSDKAAYKTAFARYEETGVPTMGLIASQKSFNDALESGAVNMRRHPDFPELAVYDYSMNTHFSRGWTDITTECRGLILNTETGEIVARPFKKFYNNQETDVPDNQFPRTGPIEVMEKSDGSMGILSPRPDGTMAISTRGSMNSDQAIHATELYNEKYAGTWNPDPDYTYCFEIIYPDNRIVVDYGMMDDIVLLGARHKATGVSASREKLNEAGWTGPQVKLYQYDSFADVLTASETGIKGEEGFVVHFLDHDKRVKLKFAEYLEMHKSVTNLTPLRVYEGIVSGNRLSAYPDFPDEFYNDVKEAEKRIDTRCEREFAAVKSIHADVVKNLPEGYSRKDFALALREHEGAREQSRFSQVMSVENGAEDRAKKSILDNIRPHGAWGFTSFFGQFK